MTANCVRDFIRFLCLLLLFVGAESTLSVSGRANIPAQCFDHTIINDESRNIDASGSTQCDTMFIAGPKWIRFVGQGGTQLPMTPTNFDRCGAQATGWYAGPMPDALLTMQDVNVCFSWQNSSCHWRNTISVTNCGSFYVYRLSMPPVCPARYCTETPAIPTTTTTTTEMTTTTSTPFIPPQCFEHQTINDSSRNVNFGNSPAMCDTATFNATPRWVRFVGEGGTQIPTSTPPVNRCGTNAPGWYSGSMPTDAYSTTNGSACFSWGTNACSWRRDMQVTNCGSFYVYQLTSPNACMSRYCTETPTITPTITTTEMTTTTSTPFFAPQCYDHQTINDSSRGVNFDKSTGTCDSATFNSTPRWVRFVGEGGTQIPTSAPPVNRCGTNAPGWYSGSMPTDTYSTTNGSACFSWSSNICNWQKNIQVTNCGSFYVYQLTNPPTCTLRYCTETPTIMPTITTTEMTTTTTTLPFSAPQCYDHQIINDPSRSSNATSGSVLCDQSVFNSTTTWVRFVGQGGTQIPTSPVMTNRCSTHAGGWYTGLMPSDTYSTTNGIVCFSYSSNTCFGKNDIQVTNCGSFYVYGLIRPNSCSYRYCTDTPDVATTTTTEMTTTTTTSIPFVAPQCYQHQTINDSSRSVNFGDSPKACDQSTFSLTPTWVRFVGEGGTQIPTTSPPVNRCGTDAPGWYSGSMPTDTYSTTNGSACFSWDGKPCNWQNNIQVTNCGSYYVYQLSRPSGCSLRYCTVDPSSVKILDEPQHTITTISSYFQSLFKKLAQ